MSVCVYVCARLTCYDSRDAPPNGIIEAHMAMIDVAHLCEHAIDVQSFHKHPGKCAHVEEVQQDCNHCTHKLHTAERKREGYVRGKL